MPSNNTEHNKIHDKDTCSSADSDNREMQAVRAPSLSTPDKSVATSNGPHRQERRNTCETSGENPKRQASWGEPKKPFNLWISAVEMIDSEIEKLCGFSANEIYSRQVRYTQRAMKVITKAHSYRDARHLGRHQAERFSQFQCLMQSNYKSILKSKGLKSRHTIRRPQSH